MQREIYKTLANRWQKNALRKLCSLLALLPFLVLTAQGQTTNPSPYCNVSDDCRFDPSITDVTFGSMSNNTSGCDNDGDVTYFNNKSPITATKGATVSGTVTIESNSFTDHGIAVWIDLNGDGSFSSNELVYSGIIRNHSGTSTHNVSFTIPGGAQCGSSRLRIQAAEDVEPQPGDYCTMAARFGAGEVEDYDIDINASTSQPDVGITKVLKPKKEKNDYGIEDLEVKLVNNSSQTVSANTTIPIKLNTKNLRSPRTFQYTLNSDLPQCQSISPVIGNVNLGCSGVNEITASTDWGPDVDNSNDTATKFYRGTANPDVFFSEGFESGVLGSRWTKSSNGRVEVWDGCQGPHKGQYFLSLDEGSGSTPTAYAETTVDISGSANPLLQFWWANYDGTSTGIDCYGQAGVFVSVDGGASFTRIQGFCGVDGSSWRQFRIDLKQAIKDAGLSVPANGKIVLRFAQKDTFGRCFEGFAFDDIKVVDFSDAKFEPKPANTCFPAPDTVFENSPQFLTADLPEAGYQWKINGSLVAENQQQIIAKFQRSPNDTKDTIELITASCFGIDTCERIVDIKKPTTPPITNFVADQNIIDPQDTVKFTNLSKQGPTSFSWDITPRSVPSNPFAYFWTETNFNNPISTYGAKAVFFEGGVYEVSLQTSNAIGSDTETKPAYIRVRDYHDICSESIDTDSVGTLRDGEGIYPADADCSYVIQPCAKEIDLNLDKLDLEKNQAYLRIYDGQDDSGKPLWDQSAYGPRGMTGDESHPGYEQYLTANSGAVYVEFVSSSSPQGEGFRLSWNGETQSLDSLVTSIEGDTAVCRGKSSTYVAQSNGKGSNFEWYFNPSNANLMGPPSATGDSFTVSINDSQNDTVALVTNHCSRTDTMMKVIQPQVTNSTPNVEFSASQTLVSVGQTVTLNDTTSACIRGRNWVIQPNTFNYVNNTDNQDANPEVRFTASGVYLVELTDTTNGGNVGTNTKTGYINVVDYCDPVVENLNNDIGISQFKLDEIDNSSTIGQSAYQDFVASTPAATLENDGQFGFTIERTTQLNKIHYKIWIDFNNDGDFQDANELVYQARNISGTQLKDSISIPASVNFGNYRMRIGANLGQLSNTPCGPNKYGEYEDYNVKVVPDQSAPVIQTKGGDTVDLAACQSPRPYINGAYARDEVDGIINGLNVSGSVDTSSPGNYTVTYNVTDNNGNDSSRDQVFHVEPDTNAPTFKLAGPDTFTLLVNAPYREPGYFGLMDDCAGVSSLTIDSSKLNHKLLGMYPVSYTAEDNQGNQMTKQRVIDVVDSLSPIAKLAEGDTITHNVGKRFNDPGFSQLVDNYWDSSDLMVNVNGSVNYFQLGQYKLTYHIEDKSGNKTMLTRIVNVKDLTAPTVDGPTNDTVVLDVNTSLNISNYVSINDNHSEASFVDTGGNYYLKFPSGNASQLGNYSLNLTAADENNNQTQVNLTVKVVDRVDPQISLVGPSRVKIKRFEATPYESADSVTVSDNYYQDFQITVDTSGSYFDQYKQNYASGNYNIVYQAIDPSGNTSDKVIRSVQTEGATGVNDETVNQYFDAYPNPTDGNLTVSIQGDESFEGQLSLVNSVGQTIQEIDQGQINGDYQLDLSNADAGVYFLKLNTADEVKMQQIVLTQ